MSARRIYPIVKVGDRFGDRVVVKRLHSDATCNERVRWQCAVCGEEGTSYAFNLRTTKGWCRHRPDHVKLRDENLVLRREIDLLRSKLDRLEEKLGGGGG